ncbi:MAG: cytochrome c biogenesis protein CcmE, partial [Woeseiaceae bacterium]|nr:cytochrome c biogenesis protein CcmE [Woeseiaceae bacterium]NIP21570.1 cytochrome c biogenesis protein CcmE [Woeseiaceae bacterium]
MTPRRQRMLAVGLTLAGIIIATALTLRALQDNMMFFISVTEVVAGEYPEARNFRVGGLVVVDSLEIDGLDAHFKVTDMRCEMPVRYTGVRPDLFRE